MLKIISGAQTGVDRGALDAAMELGLACGGIVPKGRRAEDGKVPQRYPVTECGSAEYRTRTERNVLDADATLILCPGKPSGGSLLTLRLARSHRKPACVVDLQDDLAAERARDFIRRTTPQVLNVAGPRESNHPGIADKVRVLMLKILEGFS